MPIWNQLEVMLQCGRNNYQALYCHWQYFVVVEMGSPGVSNLVLTDSQQFQMAQWRIRPCSHLSSHWFCTGHKGTPKALNLFLGSLKLWKGVFQLFSFRFKLISNSSQWHINKSTPNPISIPRESALGENGPSSHWSSFSSDWSWRERCSRCY